VQQLRTAGGRLRQVAQQFGVLRRTIERIAQEDAVTVEGDAVVRAGPRPGRPTVAPAVRAGSGVARRGARTTAGRDLAAVAGGGDVAGLEYRLPGRRAGARHAADGPARAL